MKLINEIAMNEILHRSRVCSISWGWDVGYQPDRNRNCRLQTAKINEIDEYSTVNKSNSLKNQYANELMDDK